MEKIIGRGAEAILIHKDGELIKRRIKKSYRLSAIDSRLRKTRTRSESKLMSRAASEIDTPHIFEVDDKRCEIKMAFIEGKVLSDYLDEIQLNKALEICKKIGESIAKLHDLEIIHGDLTTSNMILDKKQEKIFFIDFGLGFYSRRAEDKAVDLHLLKQALESKHFLHWRSYFNAGLSGYKRSENFSKVLEQLKKVEARGKYKGKDKKGPLIP